MQFHVLKNNSILLSFIIILISCSQFSYEVLSLYEKIDVIINIKIIGLRNEYNEANNNLNTNCNRNNSF